MNSKYYQMYQKLSYSQMLDSRVEGASDANIYVSVGDGDLFVFMIIAAIDVIMPRLACARPRAAVLSIGNDGGSVVADSLPELGQEGR